MTAAVIIDIAIGVFFRDGLADGRGFLFLDVLAVVEGDDLMRILFHVGDEFEHRLVDGRGFCQI